MADLGPFVAAALRDKTVIEMQAELDKKNAFLKQLHKIEIAGPYGEPVYAKGQFEEGESIDRWSWRVNLDHCKECTLEDLSSVTFWEGERLMFSVDPDPDDEDYEKGVQIKLDFPGAKHDYKGGKDIIIERGPITIFAVIYGWDEWGWRRFFWDSDYTWQSDAKSALKYLKSTPYCMEDCTIQFEAVGFDKFYYGQRIDMVKKNPF